MPCVRDISRLCRAAMAWLCVMVGVPAARADNLETCIRAAESAQEERARGRFTDARAALSVCSQDSCPAAIRADCTRWSADIEKEQPRLTFRVRARSGARLTSVRVRVDGVLVKQNVDGTPVPIDPGAHRVEFEADGFTPHPERVEMRQGAARELDVVLDEVPAPTKEPSPAASSSARDPEVRPLVQPSIIPWIAGGTAAVGLLGFTYFGLSAHSLASTLDRCAPRCNPADVQTLRTRAYLADGLLGVGLIGAGVTAWWFLLRPESSPPPKQAFLIVPESRGVTVGVAGRF
jgi:hypothetical protein